MGKNGYIWVYMGIYGYIWVYMGTYKVCMGIYGYVWVYMGILRHKSALKIDFLAELTPK